MLGKQSVLPEYSTSIVDLVSTMDGVPALTRAALGCKNDMQGLMIRHRLLLSMLEMDVKPWDTEVPPLAVCIALTRYAPLDFQQIPNIPSWHLMLKDKDIVGAIRRARQGDLRTCALELSESAEFDAAGIRNLHGMITSFALLYGLHVMYAILTFRQSLDLPSSPALGQLKDATGSITEQLKRSLLYG